MKPSEHALLRIREEMQERRISQRDLAEKMDCSQGRIAKILSGGVNLRFDDLATLAEAVGIRLTEAVRDRGMEFYAEMTPGEMRMFTVYQRRPPAVQDAIQTLLGVPPLSPKTNTDVPKRRKPGRPLNSEVTKKRAI